MNLSEVSTLMHPINVKCDQMKVKKNVTTLDKLFYSSHTRICDHTQLDSALY